MSNFFRELLVEGPRDITGGVGGLIGAGADILFPEGGEGPGETIAGFDFPDPSEIQFDPVDLSEAQRQSMVT